MNGCTFLLTGKSDHTSEECAAYLADAGALLTGRWSCTVTSGSTDTGSPFLFVLFSRFTVSTEKFLRAIGDLKYLLKWIRGGPDAQLNDLLRYESLKEKYHVPDTLDSDSEPWEVDRKKKKYGDRSSTPMRQKNR